MRGAKDDENILGKDARKSTEKLRTKSLSKIKLLDIPKTGY